MILVLIWRFGWNSYGTVGKAYFELLFLLLLALIRVLLISLLRHIVHLRTVLGLHLLALVHLLHLRLVVVVHMKVGSYIICFKSALIANARN